MSLEDLIITVYCRIEEMYQAIVKGAQLKDLSHLNMMVEENGENIPYRQTSHKSDKIHESKSERSLT